MEKSDFDDPYKNELAMVSYVHRVTGYAPDNAVTNSGRLIPLYPNEETGEAWGWLKYLHYCGGVYGAFLFLPSQELITFCFRNERQNHISSLEPDCYKALGKICDSLRRKADGQRNYRLRGNQSENSSFASLFGGTEFNADRYSVISENTNGTLFICQSNDDGMEKSRTRKDCGVWLVVEWHLLRKVVQIAKKRFPERAITLVPCTDLGIEQAMKISDEFSGVGIETRRGNYER